MKMEEIEYELFKKGKLIRKVVIKNIKPCIIAEGQISVLLQLDSELHHVLPHLAVKFPPGNVNYLEKKNILTLSIYERLITVYPSGKVSMNKTNTKEESIEIIREISTLINKTHHEVKTGKTANSMALKEKLSKIGPLTIYKCLPQTDCAECGEATCMAFAMKVLSGESKLYECMLLHEMGYANNVKCLKSSLGNKIMEVLGWKI